MKDFPAEFHLLSFYQAAKPPDLNPETEEAVSVRSSPEGPDPPVLTEVNQQDEQPLDLEGVKRKMEQERYNSVVSLSLNYLPRINRDTL